MLFKPEDIRPPSSQHAKKKTEPPLDGAIKCDKSTHTHKQLLARDIKASRLAELIPRIEKGQVWHVVGAGSWSNYDLIEHLAQFTAPAELWFSTWGLSDPGVRSVERMVSTGLITQVHVVMDGHTAVQHSGATTFLMGISTRLGVLACHAKAYILLGEELSISVITSANLTRNPYVEAGVVTESREVAEFHRDWIDRAIRRAKPFEEPQK